MEKKEFLTICDSTLKGIGFIKKGGAYYLIHGSELVGAVYLRMLISQLAFSFP